MKKFKLFFILTIICCLLVSMVGCGKVENKQNDSEIITETIDTTARILRMYYYPNSNLLKVEWELNEKYECYYYDDIYLANPNIDESEPLSQTSSTCIVCTSYIPVRQYKKCKKIFNNKEEVKVTLIINRTPSKDGDYTTVSRKVIPNF